MAEVKLNDGFAAEVEAFRTSAEGLSSADSVNVYAISQGGLSLPTVDAYQERLFRIWKLILRFGALAKKDAADMDELAARLKAVDSAGV